ncbi:hypothetical protein HNY73_001798 [Argiope bruennichi]|uniref:Uncharacterized protein n=1 Tax=Argiope bruennichi TaxID=94029 RepID=A0A8T0FRG1_ARGBR|nr:hypothetical protein HNY73_001798 [Argiope bruennichi]
MEQTFFFVPQLAGKSVNGYSACFAATPVGLSGVVKMTGQERDNLRSIATARQLRSLTFWAPAFHSPGHSTDR